MIPNFDSVFRGCQINLKGHLRGGMWLKIIDRDIKRVRYQTGNSGYVRLGGPTVLPTTLVSELAKLEYSATGSEPLEVIAACMRHREPALIYMQHIGLIWPITIFPRERLYHSPRDLTPELARGVRELKVHSSSRPACGRPAIS